MSGAYPEHVCAGAVHTNREEHTRTLETQTLQLLRAREVQREQPYSRAQIERRLTGFGDPLDLSDALRNLAAAGVINLSEERVGLFQAVSRTMVLTTTPNSGAQAA